MFLYLYISMSLCFYIAMCLCFYINYLCFYVSIYFSASNYVFLTSICSTFLYSYISISLNVFSQTVPADWSQQPDLNRDPSFQRGEYIGSEKRIFYVWMREPSKNLCFPKITAKHIVLHWGESGLNWVHFEVDWVCWHGGWQGSMGMGWHTHWL